MTNIFASLIQIAYYAIFILILARVILSWVTIGPYELRQWVFRLTEPMLAPIRRVLPSSSGMDFSPMILLIGIYILRQILMGLL